MRTLLITVASLALAGCGPRTAFEDTRPSPRPAATGEPPRVQAESATPTTAGSSSAEAKAPAPPASADPSEEESTPDRRDCDRDDLACRMGFGSGKFESREERVRSQERLIEDNPDVGVFEALDERLAFVPDQISIDEFVRKLPCRDEREDFRESLRRVGGGFDLYTSLLDDDANDERPAKWRVVWARSTMCNAVFLFDERGALRDQFAYPSRGNLALGEVLALAGERNLPELRFEEIASSSICCYPVVFHFYRVAPRGRFQQLLSHARSHDNVEKGVLRDYHYQFRFSDGELSVKRTFPDAEQRPAEQYIYDPSVGRYEPTPGTRKLLSDEAASERAAEASH